jgi:4-amino-4-deoxy-L-arabinose transferase-like glycosyltransferase
MNNRDRKILFAIIFFSVIVRVIAAFYLGNRVEALPGTHDQISYHTLSTRIIGGHGLTFGENWWPATKAGSPTAHWSYLYLGYLSGIYKFMGVNPMIARLIQAIIVGIFQPYLAFLIGRRIFNEKVGLVSAVFTAIYGYFIYYAASLMTESFYIVAIMISLYLAILISDHRNESGIEYHSGQDIKFGIALGVSLAIAILLRQLFLLFVPCILIWLLWRGGRKLVKPILLSGVIILIVILPFTIFNNTRFNRFVLLNTNAGFAFFWGNHPIYGDHFEPILPESMGSYQKLIPKELIDLDEAALDQELLIRGIQFVINDPARYLRLSISRIPPYFMFWPSNESSLVSNIVRVGSFGILLPLMLYGLVLSVFRSTTPYSKQPLTLLYLCITLYTIIHLLTWTLIRYRLPVDAILVIFAGYGIIDLLYRIPKARVWLQQPT